MKVSTKKNDFLEEKIRFKSGKKWIRTESFESYLFKEFYDPCKPFKKVMFGKDTNSATYSRRLQYSKDFQEQWIFVQSYSKESLRAAMLCSWAKWMVLRTIFKWTRIKLSPNERIFYNFLTSLNSYCICNLRYTFYTFIR